MRDALRRTLRVPGLVRTIAAALSITPGYAAHAQDAAPPAAQNLPSDPLQDPIHASNRQIYAGVGGQRLQYTETIDDHFGDSEIGKQAAANLGASWMGSLVGAQDLLVQGGFEFARGKTAYTGFLQNLQTGVLTPYNSSTDIETADWHVRIGGGFEDSERTGMIVPFVEFGEHRWVRDSTKTDPYGYLEVYKHKYLDGGLLGQVLLAPRLVGALRVGLGTTFGAKIDAPALGVSSGLKHERTLGCSLAIDYAPAPHLHLKAEYRDVSFRYGRSAVSTSLNLFEPDSYSYQSTAFLSIGFGF